MAVAHLRVELFGTLLSGAEKWSMGFSTAPPAGGGLADVEALALTATTLFESECWSGVDLQSYIPGTTAFVGAKVSQYNAAGVVTQSAESVLTTPDNGLGSNALPPQVSEVISLRTPLAGARHRGRMYFPAFATSGSTSNGRLNPTARDELAARMQDFFDTWNADPTTFPVAVASAVGQEVVSVTGLSVGDVFDTQRRRRDQLPESYVTLPVTI